MEPPVYAYETLCTLTADVAADYSPPEASIPSDPEPYLVFRNKISLSSLESSSTVTSAPDYFSLDVDVDGADEPSQLPSSTDAPDDGDERDDRKLESGWFRADCRFKSPMLQLHKEILDFCEFLSPTPEEQAVRNAAIDSVFDIITYIWPNSTPEVFGSFKTGLYLPSSDIDIVILASNIKTPQIGLQALSRALSQRGIAKNIQVIGKARVPIVKFVEKTSGISFDVSFDVDNGPKAAEYIKNAVLKIPSLRPLCLILKVFLQQRELNEVYSGGISSYALLSMVIAMLRVKFFELYAHKLNTVDVGVSCNGRGTFFMKNTRGFQVKGRPYLISIEDPQGPENDIGKSSYNYFQVRSAFMTAYSTLINTKTIMSLGPSKSILGTIIRPDPVLLERKGGANGEITFTDLLPGVSEPLELRYDEKQDLLCNWLLADDFEDLLPRGDEKIENGSTSAASSRKRKVSKERWGKQRESGGLKRGKVEDNSCKKDAGGKRKRLKDYGDVVA